MMQYMELPFRVKERGQIILFIGIQASGKSTFYRSLLAPAGLKHVNLDTLRTRNREATSIHDCLDRGASFVVDNTNPQVADRQRYIPLAKAQGYEVIGIFFQSRVKDCIRRNEQREHPVPRHAIPCTSNKLEMPSLDEGFDKLYFARIVDDGFEITEWKE